MKQLGFICVLAALATPAAAAEGTLTLEEACEVAVANHPQLKAAKLESTVAADDVAIARSDYYPQLNGGAVRAFADAGTRIGVVGTLTDPTILDRGSFGLGVSQLITDFGRTSDLVSSTKATLVGQQERVKQTEDSVVLDVTRAYFDVLRAEALVRVAETTRAARNALYERISGLHEAKMRSDLDLSIAKQGLADAELLLLKARTGVDDAYATLAQTLGTSSITRPNLVDRSDLPAPPPNDRGSLVSLAIDHNPALRALVSDVEAARKRADAERKASYPTISALGYAGVSPQRDPAGVLRPHYATGGVVLNVPLFTGGRLNAEEDRAEAQAAAMEQRLEDQKNVLTRDVNIAYGNTLTAFQNIGVTDQLQRNAENTLDLTQNLYEIGKSSIVDLNQAQLAATQAEIIHTEAIFGYRFQRTLLDYLTGAIESARS